MTETTGKRGNGFKDMTGQIFGKLTVLKYAGVDSNRAAVWLCRCDCGEEVEVRGTALRKGDRKSCGCLDRRRGGKPRKVAQPLAPRVHYWVVERQGLLILVRSLLGDEALVEFDAGKCAWVCSECGPQKCDHIDGATKGLSLADVQEVASVVAPRKPGASGASSAAQGMKDNDRARAVALAKTAIERAEQAKEYDRQHQQIVGEVTTRQMTDEDRARIAARRAAKSKAFAY